MGSQETEILKGTLEGIVLTLLENRPMHGYEITSWLRENGFPDTAEGTVYALLIRIQRQEFVVVEAVQSVKGPPRKIYSLSESGRKHLESFWTTWNLISECINKLREGEPT